MDPSTLIACFEASFSPNANIRVRSELELRKFERIEGMPSTVLQIIAAPSSSPATRQAAAVYLKNRVSRSWSSGKDVANAPSTYVPIYESDRNTIKQNLLHVLNSTHQKNVQVQLKTCMATITSDDFPDKWPNLLQDVIACIQSGNQQQMEGGLLTLVEILKVWRYRRSEREVPNKICEQIMPILVNFGQQLLASHPVSTAPENVGTLLHLIAKAYKTSMVADLSPHQASQQSIVQWGTFLLQIVCRVVPEELQPQDPDDREKWSWWKAKKWAHHVLNRLYSTYGSPSQLPSNRKHLKDFADNFEAHFAPEILKAYLRCVEGHVNGHIWMSKRCTRFVLEFLEDCVRPKAMWQQLKPHLDLLIGHFVFPSICLTDEEIEQFDEDPVEYCRAHFGDFMEDWFSSPITAALSFIQVLTKLRKQTTLMPMLNVVNSIVSEYPSKRSAKEKDGALRMLTCLAPTVVRTKGVGDQMQAFFISYVFPEFSSKVGHLRVRALDMVEKFEECDMAWPESERLTEMFGMVMTCMTDPCLPVRVQAALALPELVRYEDVRSVLAANVGRLMQELLKLSEETDIDALSKPTRALVTNFSTELMPFATDISTQMRDSYLRLIGEIVEMRSKNNADDLLSGNAEPIFGADESDEKTLVAANILQTLETLLRSVSTAPPIVAQLETVLLPALSLSIQHEFVELYDDLFELAHSLTYFQRSISQNMWRFFEQLYTLIKGSGIDFIEEMINVLDNYVTYGAAHLATNDTYKNMLLDIYETTQSSESLGAADRVSAMKLAGETMLALKGSIDDHIERYVMRAMSFVTRENSREEPIVTQELHANSLELIVIALYYNARLTLSILSRNNAAEAFFKSWFKKLSIFTRVYDRKIGILAITAMLTSMPDQLASMPGLPEQLMQAALTLFEGLPQALTVRKQKEEEFGADADDDDDEEEEEDNDPVVGDDDDIYDETNEYAELLVRKQREFDAAMTASLANGSAADGEDDEDDDDDDDEDDYDEEEGVFGAEQLFETPLDKQDSYITFAGTIQSLQHSHQKLFLIATGSLDQKGQQALHAIAEKAQQGGENLKPTTNGA